MVDRVDMDHDYSGIENVKMVEVIQSISFEIIENLLDIVYDQKIYVRDDL